FAGHEEDGFYIDGHHCVPILLADLKGGGSADHARIVEENVNATEFADGAFDHAPAVGRAGHVGTLKDGAASGGGDFARELFASFLVQVDNGDRRALAGKEQCGGAADTASAAGDESRLVMELFRGHISSQASIGAILERLPFRYSRHIGQDSSWIRTMTPGTEEFRRGEASITPPTTV